MNKLFYTRQWTPVIYEGVCVLWGCVYVRWSFLYKNVLQRCNLIMFLFLIKITQQKYVLESNNWMYWRKILYLRFRSSGLHFWYCLFTFHRGMYDLSSPCGFTYMTMMNTIIQQLYVNLNSCRLCQMSQTCNWWFLIVIVLLADVTAPNDQHS